MAIQFPDLNPGGPTPTSNIKHREIKVVRLLAADFTTAGANSVKAVLPADATMTGLTYWKKTAFSGGSVSAVTLSIGIPGTATQYVNATDVHTAAAGTQALFPVATNLMQPYGIPQGPDISLLFTGTATTGNPTAGEMYVIIEYVR